ncbi:MAG: ABC transporter permease [Chitinophagaceae bacterium]
MNVSFYIAKRIAFNKQPSFSRFIIRLSVAATALSVAVMILTIGFVNGFQEAISDKVFQFWGQIRIQKLSFGNSLFAEEMPITEDQLVLERLKSNQSVKYVQSFATKSAVVEHKKNIEGILFKGIQTQYDSSVLQQFKVKGRFSVWNDSLYGREIMVSEALANSLAININDTINLYFVQPGMPQAKRKLRVSGIYKTGIEEFDKLFVIGDIRLVQRVNNWQNNEIGGYEMYLHQLDSMANIKDALLNDIPVEWTATTIEENIPTIFDWLKIQNVNRNVLFIVMSFVAAINLISCLFILLLERTKAIGVLKAIGATDRFIQNIFLYYAFFISITGVLIGTIIGIGIAFLQDATHFIQLNEAAYYISYAPIKLAVTQVFTVIIATFAVCFISLLIPLQLIKRMNIVKAIKFK